MVATKRRFDPNLQRVRVLLKGKATRAYVCTRCLKAGKVQEGHLSLPASIREWRIDRMTDRIARRPHGRTAGRPTAPTTSTRSRGRRCSAALEPRPRRPAPRRRLRRRRLHAPRASRRPAAASPGSTTAATWCGSPRPDGACRGEAERLPFADGAFTAVSSIVAFFFFPDPVPRSPRCVASSIPARAARDLHDGARGEGNRGGAVPTRDARALLHRRGARERSPRERGLSLAASRRPDPWAQLLVAQP